MFKLLSVLLWLIGIFALLLAVIIHVVNNAKGIGPTHWEHKTNALCIGWFALFAGAGTYLWDL